MYIQSILNSTRAEYEKINSCTVRTLIVTDGKAFWKLYEENLDENLVIAISLPVILIPIGRIKNDIRRKLEKEVTTNKLIIQHEELRKKGDLSEKEKK